MLLRPERKASPRVSNSGSVNQHNEALKITYGVVFLDILISLDNMLGEPESPVTQLSALSGEKRNDNLPLLNWVFCFVQVKWHQAKLKRQRKELQI